MADVRGRKPIFENGATPLQDLVALLLALGKKPYDISRKFGLAYQTLRRWQKYPLFLNLIENYRKQFIKQIQDKGFDDNKFLTDTMVESMQAPAHRADGLRARELMAKIRGEFSPEEMEIKIKKELSQLTDKELIKLAEEAANANISTTNSSRNTEEER